MADLVSHVVSTGLERGRYYRVYVTQVTAAGIESERSEPAIIRVGDVECPPAPVLSIDTSYGVGGCHSNNGFVDVGITWTTPECDDLWQYYIYTSDHLSAYTGDGVYPKTTSASAGYQKVLTGSTNSFVLPRQTQGWLYIGIQAIDYSHNLSDIYVIKIMAEDTSSILRPTSPVHVDSGGIWSLRVWTECPESSQIEQVLFYRDGWRQLAPVPFASGLIAEITDTLDAIDGLTHWYTYRYLDRNGHLSPMSEPSEAVTASAIDTSHIDQVSLDALKTAWQSETVEDIDALRESLRTQSENVQSLATELASVTESYRELYDRYTLIANQIELLSASSETTEAQITDMQTSITQNSREIQLRALKTYVDTATSTITNAYAAAIDLQADRITSLVSELNGDGVTTGSITVLSNQIQQKVSRGDVQAAFDLAIQNGLSVAQITADRIILNGSLLINNNARIAGKLYADDIALVNADGSVAWGTGSGDLHPVVTDSFDSEQHIATTRDFNGWNYHADKSYPYIPQPRITFGGTCRVATTTTVKVMIAIPKDNFANYDDNGNEHYDYTKYNNYNLQFMVWEMSDGDPNLNWTNIDAHGTASVNLGAMSKNLITANEYIGYDALLYSRTISFKRTFSLPIGEQKTFTLYFRTRNLSNGESFNAIPGQIMFYDRTFHIECL